MSSSDSNCLENYCQDCCNSLCQDCVTSCNEKIEESCQNCTQSCTESCTRSCSESCSQTCSDSCGQSCSSSCSSSCCSSSSSSLKLMIGFVPLALCELALVFIIGLFQSFNPLGPFYLTLIGSVFLSISLSGISPNFKSKKSICSMKNLNEKLITSSHIGKLTINHSHHPLRLIELGHEFKVGSRYFCTGCYGLLAGTIISIIISLLYMTMNISNLSGIILIAFVPLGLIPIIVRYYLIENPSNIVRFLSNALLPISCCFLLISIDTLFHQWIFNELAVLLIIFAALLRDLLARMDNK